MYQNNQTNSLDIRRAFEMLELSRMQPAVANPTAPAFGSAAPPLNKTILALGEGPLENALQASASSPRQAAPPPLPIEAEPFQVEVVEEPVVARPRQSCAKVAWSVAWTSPSDLGCKPRRLRFTLLLGPVLPRTPLSCPRQAEKETLAQRGMRLLWQQCAAVCHLPDFGRWMGDLCAAALYFFPVVLDRPADDRDARQMFGLRQTAQLRPRYRHQKQNPENSPFQNRKSCHNIGTA